MHNKNVGYLIVGIAILILIIIIIFNQGMTSIVNDTCSHGSSCTMYTTIKTQTYLSLSIAGLVLVIGLFFILSKENEKIVIRQIRPIRPTASLEPRQFDKKSLENLDQDEARIMNLLLENKGNMFQSDIIEKTKLNKVKVTRILDSLEAQGLIERKRRGMTNIVVLKQ